MIKCGCGGREGVGILMLRVFWKKFRFYYVSILNLINKLLVKNGWLGFYCIYKD